MSVQEVEQATDVRNEELADALQEVRQKINSARSKRADTAPEPCLVAVSKYKPASDILACVNLGQLDFGENYVNELTEKASALPESIRWHFIGNLQSNKCKTVAGVPNLYCLHTLDSIKKADALQKALPSTRKERLKVMIQVNTSGEESKSGLKPLSNADVDASEVVALARHIIKACPSLELYGLMTIGSFEASTSSTENPDFIELINSRNILQDILRGDSQLGEAWGPGSRLALSMGMSADFEEAIKAGSDALPLNAGEEKMRVVEAAPPAEPTPTDNDQWLGDDGNNDDHLSKGEGSDGEEAINEGGEEEYDEGDYDAEAEAEAVARALGDQIWAGLGQGLGDTIQTTEITRDDTTDQPTTGINQRPPEGVEKNEDNDTASDTLSHDHRLPTTGSLEQSPQPAHTSLQPDAPAVHDPMIETIKTMLSLALCDPHVHYALMTTIVPGPVANGANLYTILSNSVLEGRVNPELAEPLSILISALASGSMLVASEAVYSASPHPDPTMSTSPLKRKREPADDGQAWPVHTAYNPSVQPTNPSHPSRSPTSAELVARIQSATSDILQVLDPLLSTGRSLSQPVLSSIQRQLHQVYSFVSTCPQQQEPVGGGSLQEIGGLIQVIGILNGVPIAQSTESAGHPEASTSDSNRGGRGSNTFSTSIYPCSTCSKAFNKLSSLRAHERTHSEGRPYRCEYAGCPASFARNHDLRRHEKSHERQMFRCRGCDRLFSRRDALRRHKTNEKALDECRDAPMDTSTVQHDGDPPRVTRVWQNHPEGGDWLRESEFEDGEIQPDAVSDARRIVGTLYKTLQQHVTKGLSAGGDGEQSGHQPLPGDAQGEHTDSVQTEVPVALSVDILQEGATEEVDDATRGVPLDTIAESKPVSTLPGYGLDNEHASLLERAIAVAAQAAQAQAEAEAAMYEGLYDEEQDADEWGEEGNEDKAEQEASVEGANLVC